MANSIAIIAKQWFNMFMLCMKSSKKQIKTKFATDYRDLFRHRWTHVIMHTNIYHQIALACVGQLTSGHQTDNRTEQRKKTTEKCEKVFSANDQSSMDIMLTQLAALLLFTHTHAALFKFTGVSVYETKNTQRVMRIGTSKKVMCMIIAEWFISCPQLSRL